MKLIDKLKFSIGRWALRGMQRSYSEVAEGGRQLSDWIMSGISEDADLQANWPALVQRARDLFKLNPYVRKIRVDQIANVFGSSGIVLQMKIKEEADRVVYTAEQAYLQARQKWWDDLRSRGKDRGVNLRSREFVEIETTGTNGSTRAKATVKTGQPDVYANNLLERAWKEWQKRENCTANKRHTYTQTREHRLTMCSRDGDVFIRHIRGPQARNKFGYAIQLIAAEWIDHGLNQNLPDGKSYIKMGVEYNEWDEVVAYYVIKRRPGDWISNYATGLNGRWSPGWSHERVEARDMIHYCAFEDSSSGRGAPWIISVMTKLRHIDKYSEAAVIAARAECCKGGHYETNIPGLDPATLADEIEKIGKNGEKLTNVVEPAMWKPLPPFWTAKSHDPKHPSGNYPAFKKESLREVSVGAGDFYNTMAGDMEGVNYSSMRGGFLDIRELWMLIQCFDIDTAERPIFENFLEMALTTGAIPLPLTKFDKFNQPTFQGRRWPWVDPKSDALADSAQLKMLTTSRTRICNENGVDFEEIVEEQAIEKILAEEAGLSAEVDVISAPAGTDQTGAYDIAPTPKKSRKRKPALTTART